MTRYRTAYGSYAVTLCLGPAGIAVTTISFSMLGMWPMAALGVVLLGVSGWTLLSLGYVVDENHLHVRLGFYRKRIPLGQITRVDGHRMRNGPMLGLGSDFIGIEYGEKAINVSPKDVDGFVRALGATRLPPEEARSRRANNVAPA